MIGISAVHFIEYPYVFGSCCHTAAGVGVEVELADGVVGVIVAGDKRIGVDVYAQPIVLHRRHP